MSNCLKSSYIPIRTQQHLQYDLLLIFAHYTESFTTLNALKGWIRQHVALSFISFSFYSISQNCSMLLAYCPHHGIRRRTAGAPGRKPRYGNKFLPMQICHHFVARAAKNITKLKCAKMRAQRIKIIRWKSCSFCHSKLRETLGKLSDFCVWFHHCSTVVCNFSGEGCLMFWKNPGK